VYKNPENLKNGVIALSFLNLLKSLASDQEKNPNTRGKSNWHLAYTLLNNGELKHYRKHSIKMQGASLLQKVVTKGRQKYFQQSNNDEMTEGNLKMDDEIYIKPVETKTTKLDETD